MSHQLAPHTHVHMLAIDLDDTLLGTDLTISKTNRNAIRYAEDCGVRVVLASGRAPEALYPYAQQLGMDTREGYLITFNGSSILRSDTRVEEWGVKLDAQLVGEIWDLAHDVGSVIQSYIANEIIYNIPNKFTELDHKVTGIPMRQVNRAEFTSAARVKINLAGEPEFLSTIEGQFLKKFAGRANMFRTKPFFFEIMHPHADKGLALEKLSSAHGIQQANVMTIGDALNDAGMLRWAGISVAMANALPAIRNMATWVTTKTNDEDGVAEAIDRYIGNGKHP